MRDTEKMRGPVTKRMRNAYHAGAAHAAEALETLVRGLDKTYPGVAGSLREGIAETLTSASTSRPPSRGPCAAPTP